MSPVLRSAVLVLAFVASAAAEPAAPPPEDRSFATLVAYQEALLRDLGGAHRDIALERKAQHFEWLLFRYHWTPDRNVAPRVELAEEPGAAPTYLYGADTSTWNGALLAALSYAYSVRRDPELLARIAELVEGLHHFQVVTERYGLPARCALRGEPRRKAVLRHIDRDGDVDFFRADPAKGTYNQLWIGYAALWIHALHDLPAESRALAADSVARLTGHLLKYDYRVYGRDGRPTRYGDLRPWRFGLHIPFNAQVSYLGVATGHHYPVADDARRALFAAEFERLRREHVYYESPWKPPFLPPQRVARVSLLKHNDLNHVTNAAFLGVRLELEADRRGVRPADPTLLHQLGRTLFWSARRLEAQRNSLANFQWAALAADPDLLATIAGDGDDLGRERTRAAHLLDVGVEQLRRFPLDRFRWEGHRIEAEGPLWVEDTRPDAYYWKAVPTVGWKIEGDPTPHLTSAIDYLHAYWLLRASGLDRDPTVRTRHGAVLGAGTSVPVEAEVERQRHAVHRDQRHAGAPLIEATPQHP